MTRPVVFEFFDFRMFLQKIFAYKKAANKKYSYRCFAGKAGFASPNFLKLVMDGNRNLTSASIAKIAKGFGLKKKEREYFENLVFMNQAADHDEKNHYYLKMIAAKGSREARKIEKAAYEYFSKWYFPAIRELATFGNGKNSPEQIASALHPVIKANEAEKALQTLSSLGLIKKTKDGRWEQADKIIITGPEVRSFLITTYHLEMIRLAGEAIDRYPAEKRDISALTLGVKKERLGEIKKKIITFKQELLELFSTDEDPDQVLQVNVQAFPLTKD